MGATPEKTSRTVQEFVDLDDILYPDPDSEHGEAWGEFVFVAWMREADDYELGDDARLFAAARALQQSE
jgi:hypothetical protein